MEVDTSLPPPSFLVEPFSNAPLTIPPLFEAPQAASLDPSHQAITFLHHHYLAMTKIAIIVNMLKALYMNYVKSNVSCFITSSNVSMRSTNLNFLELRNSSGVLVLSLT